MLKFIDKLKLKFGKNEKKNELELRKEPEQKKELEPRKGDNQGPKGNKLLNIGLGFVIIVFGGWLYKHGITLLALEHIIPITHVRYIALGLIGAGLFSILNCFSKYGEKGILAIREGFIIIVSVEITHFFLEVLSQWGINVEHKEAISLFLPAVLVLMMNKLSKK